MKAQIVKSASTTTQEYYDRHATEYCEATRNRDLGEIYDRFLEHLSPGAHILDAGSGSGRDTKIFLKRGYQVTAIDASPKLARLADEYTHHPCQVLRFQDLAFERTFDGVWACASLLHVPRNEMEDVLFRFGKALKPGGIMYVSLKEGEGELVAGDGRFFRNYTRSSFEELLTRVPQLHEIGYWKTDEVPTGNQTRSWLGFLLKRER
jgi:SAM-dependent methyltransferase